MPYVPQTGDLFLFLALGPTKAAALWNGADKEGAVTHLIDTDPEMKLKKDRGEFNDKLGFRKAADDGVPDAPNPDPAVATPAPTQMPSSWGWLAGTNPAMDTAAPAPAPAPQTWWQNNQSWALPTAIGTGGLAAGGLLAYLRNRNRKKNDTVTAQGADEKLAADLSPGSAGRSDVAKKDFALPNQKEPETGSKGRYPIPDKAHARAALGFAAMHHGHGAEYQAVKRKVEEKFGIALPGMPSLALPSMPVTPPVPPAPSVPNSSLQTPRGIEGTIAPPAIEQGAIAKPIQAPPLPPPAAPTPIPPKSAGDPLFLPDPYSHPGVTLPAAPAPMAPRGLGDPIAPPVLDTTDSNKPKPIAPRAPTLPLPKPSPPMPLPPKMAAAPLPLPVPPAMARPSPMIGGGDGKPFGNTPESAYAPMPANTTPAPYPLDKAGLVHPSTPGTSTLNPQIPQDIAAHRAALPMAPKMPGTAIAKPPMGALGLAMKGGSFKKAFDPTSGGDWGNLWGQAKALPNQAAEGIKGYAGQLGTEFGNKATQAATGNFKLPGDMMGPEVSKFLDDNRWANYAAWGAPIGAGIGLVGGLFNRKKKRNALGDMMTGGLLGAGVGAAGGLGHDLLAPKETPQQASAAPAKAVVPPVPPNPQAQLPGMDSRTPGEKMLAGVKETTPQGRNAARVTAQNEMALGPQGVQGQGDFAQHMKNLQALRQTLPPDKLGPVDEAVGEYQNQMGAVRSGLGEAPGLFGFKGDVPAATGTSARAYEAYQNRLKGILGGARPADYEPEPAPDNASPVELARAATGAGAGAVPTARAQGAYDAVMKDLSRTTDPNTPTSRGMLGGVGPQSVLTGAGAIGAGRYVGSKVPGVNTLPGMRPPTDPKIDQLLGGPAKERYALDPRGWFAGKPMTPGQAVGDDSLINRVTNIANQGRTGALIGPDQVRKGVLATGGTGEDPIVRAALERARTGADPRLYLSDLAKRPEALKNLATATGQTPDALKAFLTTGSAAHPALPGEQFGADVRRAAGSNKDVLRALSSGTLTSGIPADRLRALVENPGAAPSLRPMGKAPTSGLMSENELVNTALADLDPGLRADLLKTLQAKHPNAKINEWDVRGALAGMKPTPIPGNDPTKAIQEALAGKDSPLGGQPLRKTLMGNAYVGGPSTAARLGSAATAPFTSMLSPLNPRNLAAAGAAHGIGKHLTGSVAPDQTVLERLTNRPAGALQLGSDKPLTPLPETASAPAAGQDDLNWMTQRVDALSRSPSMRGVPIEQIRERARAELAEMRNRK